MRLRLSATIIGLAALLSACAASRGVYSTGRDGTFVLHGQYTAVSHSTANLQKDLQAEADKRCPEGWTKIRDTANPSAMTGGRIWTIRCRAGEVATGAGAAVGVGPAAAVTSSAGSPAPTAAMESAATNAGTTMSREELVSRLTNAVRRAAPYLAPEAARAIVEAQMNDLGELVRALTNSVLRAAPYLTPEAARAIVRKELNDLTAAQIRILAPGAQPAPPAPSH